MAPDNLGKKEAGASPHGRWGLGCCYGQHSKARMGLRSPSLREVLLVGAEPRLWGIGRWGCLGSCVSSGLISILIFLELPARKKNKTQTHHPKGKCFLHLPTQPSLCHLSESLSIHPPVGSLFHTHQEQQPPGQGRRKAGPRGDGRRTSLLDPPRSSKLWEPSEKSQGGEDVSPGS